MDELYDILPKLGEFSEAGAAFFQIIETLQSEASQKLTHGTLEEVINRQGREILRLLFQGHLDQRAREEAREEAVIGSDGEERGRCRERTSCVLQTLFGEVRVNRKGYSSAQAGSLFPLEIALNLPPDKYSDGLRCQVAVESSKNSFDEALSTINDLTAQHVGKRQAEELVDKIALDFEAFYEQGSMKREPVEEDLLILSFDGKGVVVRQEDLREATQKAALAASSQTSRGRLAPGEKKNRKRMAEVATVYSLQSQQRSAEEIMGIEDPLEEGSRPKAVNKRLWASLERDPEEVIREAFEEALARDPLHQKQWLALVDGNEHQISKIEQIAQEYQVKSFIILDFIHVLEYLWKAAYCFHPVASQEAEGWVQARALSILRGNSSSVAAGMRQSATKRQLEKTQRKAVDKCADYLLKYRFYLQYDCYCPNGWPIASGVIEGACRHLVKDRMELTGARWGLKSAEAVLKIRALRSSGDWEEYWKFHKCQEQQRNHFDLYDDDFLEKAA